MRNKALALLGAASLIVIAVTLLYDTSKTIVGGDMQYATSTFTVTYPRGYSVEEGYVNEIAPGRRAEGVKFVVNPSLAAGTNLSADSFVSVEWLPTLMACDAAPYLSNPVIAPPVHEGDRTYLVAMSSGAGAGNFYEETVYARRGDKGCVAVRYRIHSTNIGNYDPGTVRVFDKQKLLEQFDGIRRSVTLL